MADVALDKAISDAATELEKSAAAATPPKEKETSPDETTETGGEENEDTEEGDTAAADSESEDEMSDDEVKESKNLYKLLKDPKTRNAVLAALAQEAGILPKAGTEGMTKKETATAKKEIKDIVKEALGDQYSFISDKIAAAFEQVLEQERSSNEEKILDLQRQQVEKDVIAEHSRLARETKGESRKFENRMAELATEIPVGTMDMRTYIRRLYTIASSEKSATKAAKPAEQIRRNASDASARLKSGASPLSDNAIPDKKMSLDESIKWAQQQIDKGKR